MMNLCYTISAFYVNGYIIINFFPSVCSLYISIVNKKLCLIAVVHQLAERSLKTPLNSKSFSLLIFTLIFSIEDLLNPLYAVI